MSLTEVDICNQALIICGANIISDLTDDTKEGNLCRTMYPLVRDQFISSHPWNFAIRRKELAPDVSVGTDVWDWDYAYTIPQDVHRVLDIQSDDLIWKKEDNKIYANHTPIRVRYIAKIENPSSYPAYFAEALANQLAKSIVYALTQSAAARDSVIKEALEVVRSARSFDAQEGSVNQVIANDWLRVRR